MLRLLLFLTYSFSHFDMCAAAAAATAVVVARIYILPAQSHTLVLFCLSVFGWIVIGLDWIGLARLARTYILECRSYTRYAFRCGHYSKVILIYTRTHSHSKGVYVSVWLMVCALRTMLSHVLQVYDHFFVVVVAIQFIFTGCCCFFLILNAYYRCNYCYCCCGLIYYYVYVCIRFNFRIVKAQICSISFVKW